MLDVGAVGLDANQLPPWQDGPINLRSWFAAQQRDWPLELEIGSGKGTFLVQQAVLAPHVNYIGIEYAKAYWSFAADRCRRHGLGNVKLLHVEADLFVRNYVPPACLQQVHLYFPDPWPKNRHHKRRLLKAPFLRQLHRAMKPAALIRIVTDHEGYHEWIVAEANKVNDLFEPSPWPNPPAPGTGELVGTNFERKYLAQVKHLCAMVLRRR